VGLSFRRGLLEEAAPPSCAGSCFGHVPRGWHGSALCGEVLRESLCCKAPQVIMKTSERGVACMHLREPSLVRRVTAFGRSWVQISAVPTKGSARFNNTFKLGHCRFLRILSDSLVVNDLTILRYYDLICWQGD
jgi:hypothetical protein